MYVPFATAGDVDDQAVRVQPIERPVVHAESTGVERRDG
jgi:hypothetical protein